MMTHAYNEIYLDDAMENLGSAFEYATLFCNIKGQEFFYLFLSSGIAHEYGRGNVKYISGMSGIELASLILTKCGKVPSTTVELPYIDYPPEYWIGWILAYYQWYTGKSFARIYQRISYDTLYNLYGVLHEADPQKTVAVLNELMIQKKKSNLARLRKFCNLSQSQLAKAANISVRSIQLYEQHQTDINKAQYHHLLSLAKVLGCHIEDLLEP